MNSRCLVFMNFWYVINLISISRVFMCGALACLLHMIVNLVGEMAIFDAFKMS